MPAGRLGPDDRARDNRAPGRRLRAAPICVTDEPGRSAASAGAARRAPGRASQGRRPGADAGPAAPQAPRLTVAQLQTFLQRARSDRFFALWVLEATSGMRRCELAGARRDLLDLAKGTLEIDVTRVVVDGQVIESDGKTENAQHMLALDPFTLAALKAHVEMLDRERKDRGPDYRDHGVLFCWEDGTPPHPDTITRRFKQLAAAAGLPEIDLHDVRHSYATAGRDAKIDWKALSRRIGHADVAFTMKQYVQTDLEADRRVATTLAELIIGGSLASTEVTDQARGRASLANPLANDMQEALFLFERGPLPW